MFSLDNTAIATLSEDGKTVTITTTAALETSLGIVGSATPFKFTVTKGIKDLSEAVTTVISVNDTVAPKFVKATAAARTTTNTIVLEFSEPVVWSSGIVKVNGVNASVAIGTTPNTLNVTTGANLAANSTHNIEILNFVDFAGNFINPNPVSSTVTVSQNISAPVITDVQVVRDNLVEVTFDKAMDLSKLTNATVRLLDGNATNLASTNISGITPKANTSNRVFQIALTSVAPNSLPFNTNGVFNATLVFTDSIEDSVGNKLVTTQRSISIVRDTVDPTVVSVKHIKADSTGATYGGAVLTNGAIAVKFNEAVRVGTLTGAILIDNGGNDVTAQYLTTDGTTLITPQINADDNTELILPLADTVTTASNVTGLTLRLPAGAAEDLSLANNDSVASVNTFATVPGTNTAGDTTAPVAANVTATAANVIQLSVTETNDLDTNTVLNLNNYRLDGAPLPSGTYATITGTAPSYVVNLHLPAGSVSTTRANYAFNVSGIKDTAGNAMIATAFNNLSLTDDVAPVFTAATLNEDGSATLSFSEVLAVDPANADFEITLDGAVVAVGDYSITAITVGSEAGKYALVVTGVDLNDASTLTIKTVDPSPVTAADAAGNTLKVGTTITVK